MRYWAVATGENPDRWDEPLYFRTKEAANEHFEREVSRIKLWKNCQVSRDRCVTMLDCRVKSVSSVDDLVSILNHSSDAVDETIVRQWSLDAVEDAVRG